MRTVKSYNKAAGITYVYEVLESHYDKEKGMSVPKRRMIGHIDPVTGEVVPNGKRGRKKKDSTAESTQKSVVPDRKPDIPVSTPHEPDYKKLYLDRNQEAEKLKKEVSILKERVRDLESVLNSVHTMTALHK